MLKKLLIALFLTVFVPASLPGQERPEWVTPIGNEGAAGAVEGEGALERPIVSETYVLQPGDEFVITVSGATNFSYPAIVSPEGKVFIQIPPRQLSPEIPGQPFLTFDTIGELLVSDLTLKKAKDRLLEEFLRYYRNVDVSLVLTKLRTFRVFVSGDVFRPGIYSANPITRVSEVVNRAKLKGMASRGKIKLIRKEKGEALVNLYRFEIEGDPGANPCVRDGDVVYVPPMKASVTVKGAVYGSGVYELRVSALTAEQTKVSEGIYELEPGERVSQILRKAGGITPWADLRNSYMERFNPDSPERRKIRVDLHRVVVEGDSAEDIELLDGDILIVASLEEKVYVQGAVNNPGAFPYQPNLRVDEYVGLAGGPTDRGNLSRVRVLRADGTSLSGKANPVVKRGDKIIVPEVTLKWWQDYLAIATAITSVVIAWLTITK